MQLGVIDTEGKAIVGVPVEAKLVRVAWTYTSHRAASGALETKWIQQRSDAGSCSATSEASPVACSLLVPSSGDYQIRAEVDGKVSGVTSIWAWTWGETPARHLPVEGPHHRAADGQGRYRPGETRARARAKPVPCRDRRS